MAYVIQAGEDPDLLVHFVDLAFLLGLDGLASHLAIIDPIKCEMNRGKASAPKAMRCDCILSNRLIPTLEECWPMDS